MSKFLSGLGTSSVESDDIKLSTATWQNPLLTGSTTLVAAEGTYYEATASSFLATRDPWRAFTNEGHWCGANVSYGLTTGSHTGSTTSVAEGVTFAGSWLQLKTGSLVRLDSIKIKALGDPYHKRTPVEWALLGSKDGSTWY